MRRIVDRMVHPSLARAQAAQQQPPSAPDDIAPPPPLPRGNDETLILAHDLVRLRRRIGIVESLAPERVEEVRKIAVDATVAIRAVRVEFEAEATQASARFAYLRQEIARYRDEAVCARELLSESAERAGDGLHAFRDLAASALKTFDDRADVVLAEAGVQKAELDALRARIDALDSLRVRIDALDSLRLRIDALDLLRARIDDVASESAVRLGPVEEQLTLLREQVGAVAAEPDVAPLESALAALGARLDALELVSFRLPDGPAPERIRIERVEVDAVRALEAVEHLRRTLAWHPEYAVAVFGGDGTSTNGSAGKRALVERFGRTFSIGSDEERDAALFVVHSAQHGLVVGESELWPRDRFAQIAADDETVAGALSAAQPATYDAIVALAYAERCGVEERFALLRGAVHALSEHGTLVLAITNGYAPEAWRRFHLDPWNTNPWMPDTWRFALASAGYRGAQFYDPIRKEYVSDVASAGGRLLVVGYR